MAKRQYFYQYKIITIYDKKQIAINKTDFYNSICNGGLLLRGVITPERHPLDEIPTYLVGGS